MQRLFLGRNPLDLELKYRQAAKEVIDTGSTKLTGFEDFVCRREKGVSAGRRAWPIWILDEESAKRRAMLRREKVLNDATDGSFYKNSPLKHRTGSGVMLKLVGWEKKMAISLPWYADVYTAEAQASR